MSLFKNIEILKLNREVADLRYFINCLWADKEGMFVTCLKRKVEAKLTLNNPNNLIASIEVERIINKLVNRLIK